MTDPGQQPEPYEQLEHAVWLLKRAFHNAHRTVNEAVRAFGVTPTQIGALNRLGQEPGLSGAELARRLLVTPQAAQLALTALEERGLVARTPDPNHGRIVRASLTKEGVRVVESALKRAYAAEEEFLAVLEPEERKALLVYLQRLARHEPAGTDEL